MKTNSLEYLIVLAKRYGFETHLYIDKLVVYFDTRVPESDLLRLKKRSKKNTLISPCTLEGYVHLSQKMELFQLDDDTLKLLRRICESNGDYKINYMELVMDFSSKSQLKTDTLRQFFNKHLVNTGKSKGAKTSPYFKDDRGTHYYHELGPIRMVMYNSKTFRWDTSRFCVHLEHRYRGLNTLKTFGIVTARDVVDFDHLAYWEKCLDLRKPNFKAIGEYVANSDVSDNALNKRGNRFFDRLNSLQEFLQMNPEQLTLFPSMDTDEALEKFFGRAFDLPYKQSELRLVS